MVGPGQGQWAWTSRRGRGGREAAGESGGNDTRGVLVLAGTLASLRHSDASRGVSRPGASAKSPGRRSPKGVK